jgi:LysW-gamma-L-lysine carboxypeptidase
MNDYAVQLLTRMLEIYSPSGREKEISGFLSKEMKNLGFQVRRDKVGNVIGEIGQGKPVVLLCGHVDTVKGHIPVRVEYGKLYGRGAVDAKSPLAAMIMAASTFAKTEPPCKIIVVGVVDEEGPGKGIKNFIQKSSSIDHAIFGEPSGLNEICLGYKGVLRLKITCETQTGHSGAPWLFDNAIEKAMEIWKRINQLHLPEEKLDSRFYSITYCLTKVRGGSTSPIVPSKCDTNIELRLPPQVKSKQVLKKIKKEIERYRLNNPQVSVKTKIEYLIDAFEADRRSLIVRALGWAIRETTHNRAVFSKKTGTGDMNILGNTMKIPVVTYGPGDSSLDHTPNEYIKIDEYLGSIKVYKSTLTKLIELLKKCGNSLPRAP